MNTIFCSFFSSIATVETRLLLVLYTSLFMDYNK